MRSRLVPFVELCPIARAESLEDRRMTDLTRFSWARRFFRLMRRHEVPLWSALRIACRFWWRAA